MTRIEQLREERKKLLARSEEIRLKYEGSAESMSGQEETEWRAILDDVDKKHAEIEMLERAQKVAEFAGQVANALPAGGTALTGDVAAARAQELYTQFLMQGNPESRNRYLQHITNARAGVDGIIARAYQSDNPSGGGYLIAPVLFVDRLITLMKDLVFMRGLATTYSSATAESFGIPALDVDPSDADWTSELGTGTEESIGSFGRRELRPHPLAKRLKVSKKLLRQTGGRAGTILLDRLAYKFSVSEEKAFLVGDGSEKPLGVFVPTALGISTNRDVAMGTAGTLKADDFIETKYKLKAQYQARGAWTLSRRVVKDVRKLKDNNNNYIWATGLGPGQGFQGQPETILNSPFYMSEYCPNNQETGAYTVAANATGYLAAFGDFSQYVIADALDMEMEVLDQLYAETNQMGYICRKETDGMPVLEEAFARLKAA